MFKFPTFSDGVTAHLLPWIALTAQLPYLTGSYLTNAIALFLAVGSPALITYSLVLTIFNRRDARKRFADLSRAARDVSARSCLEFANRIDRVGEFVTESQHGPLRLSHEDGWLASLLLLHQNREW